MMKNKYVLLLVVFISALMITNSCSTLDDKQQELIWKITYDHMPDTMTYEAFSNSTIPSEYSSFVEEFDSTSRKIALKIYSSKSDLIRVTNFKYANNKLINLVHTTQREKEKREDVNWETPTSFYTFYVNSENEMVKSNRFQLDTKGKTVAIDDGGQEAIPDFYNRKFLYDEKGLLIESIEVPYFSYGYFEIKRKKYEYLEFDVNGNWTKRKLLLQVESIDMIYSSENEEDYEAIDEGIKDEIRQLNKDGKFKLPFTFSEGGEVKEIIQTRKIIYYSEMDKSKSTEESVSVVPVVESKTSNPEHSEIEKFWSDFTAWLQMPNAADYSKGDSSNFVSKKYMDNSRLLSSGFKKMIEDSLNGRNKVYTYSASEILFTVLEDKAVGVTHHYWQDLASFNCSKIEINRNPTADSANFVTYLTMPNLDADGVLYQKVLFSVRKNNSAWELERIRLLEGITEEAPQNCE